MSCHEIHAYDETKILREVGVETFVIGARPGHLRPVLESNGTQGCDFLSPEEARKADTMLAPGGRLEKWLVDRFDVVLVLARNDWVLNYWELMKKKRVLFRMNGQSDEGTEIRLQPFVDKGMILLGYSPDENSRFKQMRVRHTIRFYKDPSEWKGWHGNVASVMTACQSIDRDGECCNPTAYIQATEGVPHVLYGPGNENFLAKTSTVSPGPLPFEEFKRKFQEHRAYLYVGTRPASYTLNFIEAWMTGCPVVSLGPSFNTHEVCQLIDHGVNGFFSDDTSEVRGILKDLLENPDVAARIGQAARKKAIGLFGIETIRRQWHDFMRALR